MGYRLSEHSSILIKFKESSQEKTLNGDDLFYDSVISKRFNESSHCFIFEKHLEGFELKADYCIGLDWLGNTGRYLYVEPKLNTKSAILFNSQTDSDEDTSDFDESSIALQSNLLELDYLKMLLQVTDFPESYNEIKDLVKIDWDTKPIEIDQKDDKLTPFLVVQYLQLIKSIVKKGLKKSYYKTQENLNNRVKGKILIGQHIKQNLLKNKHTSTLCEYQLFGEDNSENRFLKKVLLYASSYVENNNKLFGDKYSDLQHTINYCRPAFEQISNQINEYELKFIKHNSFYKDYISAIDLGKKILKKFAYNISQTIKQKVASPPFWIDMPRLFELYVYSKMIEANQDDKDKIHYQFSTYGNALDVLVSKLGFQMVIDAKYKLHYQSSHLHDDIRQVSGYARLNKVRKKLNLDEKDDKNIDCLIIYPDLENGIEELSLDNIIKKMHNIKAYHKVFKLGIKLPFIGDY